MTRGIAIIPFGIGIGDLVNMRPLAAAIARSAPETATTMVAPRHFDWLAPEGVTIVSDVPGVRTWERRTPHHPLARLAASVRVGRIAPMIRAIPVTGLASTLAHQLRLQGFDKVFNLLALFARLDLDQRWTAGPWSYERHHVIDLLAGFLESDGIIVPPEERQPRLSPASRSFADYPAVILNPSAGSTLKEAPLRLWIDVATALRARGIAPAVLSAPGRDIPQILVRAVPGCPLLSSARLHEVAAWIASADVVVSPDTGILHIASAAGTPYVGLFGSTDPWFLGPYNRALGMTLETPFEHADVCRSCWTAQIFPAGRCALYSPDSCVSGIRADSVIDAIHSVLKRSRTEAIPSARTGSPPAE
ncbi:MAG: hypothetical protein NVSMB22_09740 [Chloroflexota bacterium]